MKKEIYEALKSNIKKDSVKFLMPGHKHRLDEIIKLDSKFDFTESFDTDNLNNPQGIIKRSQVRAANIFGSKHSFYTVNGSSGGIIASVFYATKPGDDILVARNCHISVIRAAIIRGLKIHYIKTEFKDGFDTNIDFEEFKNQVDRVKPKVVVVTHPNYYGFPTEIRDIAEYCKKVGSILIVDEAHGGHFAFDEELPESAIKAGADIVIESAHKMLTGLNQSAFVHIASNRVDKDRLFKAITTFQTTSPSYPIIASCEMAASFMQVEGKKYLSENIKHAKALTDELKKLEHVNVLGYEKRDPLKIVLSIDGLSGEKLHEKLYREYNIECEMNDGLNVLLLATLMNVEEDYKKAYDAICEIAKISSGEKIDFKYELKIPTKSYDPHEAYFMEYESIKKEDAIGRIGYDFIAPYPPGIPVLVPGEIIDLDMLEYLDDYVNVIK